MGTDSRPSLWKSPAAPPGAPPLSWAPPHAELPPTPPPAFLAGAQGMAQGLGMNLFPQGKP